MKALKLLLLLCTLVPGALKANLEATILYLEQLLAEGKTVAILYVDMQTRFVRYFSPAEFYRVIPEQSGLIQHFSGNDKVRFVDVNYAEQGPTLPELLQAMKTKDLYKLFIKTTDSAFQTVPSSGESVPDSQVSSDLDVYLKSEGVTDVHITGCFDGACVRLSAKDALEKGFGVSVDRESNILLRTDFLRDSFLTPEELEEIVATRWQELLKDFPDLKLITDHPQKPCS